ISVSLLKYIKHPPQSIVFRCLGEVGISFLDRCPPSIILSLQRRCETAEIAANLLKSGQLGNHRLRSEAKPVIAFRRSPDLNLESCLADPKRSPLRHGLRGKIEEELYFVRLR